MKVAKPIWLLLIVIALFVIYFPVISKYLGLKRHEAKLHTQIIRLQEKIQKLDRENYLIRHDLTQLERVMRQELGLVKPGEEVYKIVSNETSPTAVLQKSASDQKS